MSANGTTPSGVTANGSIRALSEADLPAAAKIHAASFQKHWDAAALADYLIPSGVICGYFTAHSLRGFIILGPCTDQTDMITLAVTPEARGQSVGRSLIGAAETEARTRGARIIFLEVAEDNGPAIALYRACGYVPIGKRMNYYKRAGGRVSAVTMRKDL